MDAPLIGDTNVLYHAKTRPARRRGRSRPVMSASAVGAARTRSRATDMCRATYPLLCSRLGYVAGSRAWPVITALAASCGRCRPR